MDWVIQSAAAPAIRARLEAAEGSVHAPQLIDLEVVQALRRFVAAREMTVARAGEALADFQAIRVVRAPHPPLLERIWELRDVLSGYDATYVVLAELLGCPLVTCDARLGRVRGHRATVDVIG